MSEVGSESNPLRVAIIGAGPSGFYTVSNFLKHKGLHVVFGSGEQLIGQYPTLGDLVYTQILRNVGIAEE